MAMANINMISVLELTYMWEIWEDDSKMKRIYIQCDFQEKNIVVGLISCLESTLICLSFQGFKRCVIRLT